MHLDDLGGMLDRKTAVGTTEAMTFVSQYFFITDENHVDVEFLGGLKRTFNAGGGTMIAAHRIQCDLHAKCWRHKRCTKVWMSKGGTRGLVACAGSL